MKKDPAEIKRLASIIFRVLSIIVFLALGSSAIILGAAIYLNAPPNEGPSPNEEAMRIDEDGNLFMEVRSGESADSVGRRLEEAGIIRSRHFWSLLFRLDREFVKTGAYLIEIPSNLVQIRSILIRGEHLLVRVTIPEGFTLNQTARVMENEGICPAEDFLAAASSRELLEAFNIPGASMEGYLFPDTYLFPLAYPAAMVVEVMANNFFVRLAEIAPEAPSLSAAELNNRVILASIVEREYRARDEAALMAGVFFNRLGIGMMLQSCATVVYVITEIQGRPHPERLFNRDLEIRSPFNTYMNPGLPPGPISSPGITALRGVFEPVSSNYLYFRLIDPRSGRHYFSRTFDEHIRAGELLVKGW